VSVAKNVPIEDWGRDHWSTFAYAETCIVDQQPLSRDRLRCHSERRPHLLGPTVARFGMSATNRWKPEWGTRLKGFFNGGKNDKSRQLSDHDDWDCLEDMEAAGLLEIVSVINAIVVFTDKGIALAAHLRAHKARGGTFSNFEFKPEMLEVKEKAA
jgi:hypothetical protein